MDDETANIPLPPSQNELVRNLLRQVEKQWETDDTVSDDRRQSLSALIGTYDPASMDETFRQGFANLYALGQGIGELRNMLAAEAGIGSLARLNHLASPSDLLDRPEFKSIDITDLSDEEYLMLFTGG